MADVWRCCEIEVSPLDGVNTTPRNLTAPTAASYARWLSLALVALLVAELIVITARFDRKSLAYAPRWWVDVPRLAVAAGTAVLIIGVGVGGVKSRRRVDETLESVHPSQRWWVWGLAHLVAFAVFAWLTDVVFRGGSQVTILSSALYVSWVAAGLATIGFWGATLVRSDVQLALLKRNSGMLAAGAAVGTLAWFAGSATNWLWRPLGRGTLYLSHKLLSLVTTDTVYRPDELLVGTSKFEILIEPRCSGYEGIGLVCAFLAVYLYLFRAQLRFPNALLVFPIGSLVIWLMNSVRIAALVALGSWVSSPIAEGGFHSQAGWMAFCGVALGLVYLLHRLPFFNGEEAVPDAAQVGDPTAAYLAPMLVLVATAMSTTAFSNGFDPLYPARVLTVVGVLWIFRRYYRGASWSCSWHAVATGIVAFAIWMALEPSASAAESASKLRSNLASLPTIWAGVWLVSRFIGFVLTVPIAEEMAFRGYLARLLVSEDFAKLPARCLTWLSLVVSSVLFGALHRERWVAGTAAGLLYAFALDRRGRLSDAILAHATTNGLIAAYVLVTGSWYMMI